MESHKNDLWQWKRDGNRALRVNQGQPPGMTLNTFVFFERTAWLLKCTFKELHLLSNHIIVILKISTLRLRNHF